MPMRITEEHDEILQQLANWIKTHRNKYAPKAAVSGIRSYKQLVTDLKDFSFFKMFQRIFYKSGELFLVTMRGWVYLAETHPVILKQ